MPLIPRFRRYRPPTRPAAPLSPDDEIRFILARYDDGAIPPAILTVIERLRSQQVNAPGPCSANERLSGP